MTMTQMEKIFSEFVFGDTLPNPTLVKLLRVKYRAVTYLSLTEGPELESVSLYAFPSCSARLSSQPVSVYGLSTKPMAYHMHASQWAMSTKVHMSKKRTAAPYSEYRSSFLATRTNRNSRAVFRRLVKVAIFGIHEQEGTRKTGMGR